MSHLWLLLKNRHNKTESDIFISSVIPCFQRISYQNIHLHVLNVKETGFRHQHGSDVLCDPWRHSHFDGASPQWSVVRCIIRILYFLYRRDILKPKRNMVVHLHAWRRLSSLFYIHFDLSCFRMVCLCPHVTGPLLPYNTLIKWSRLDYLVVDRNFRSLVKLHKWRIFFYCRKFTAARHKDCYQSTIEKNILYRNCFVKINVHVLSMFCYP